VQVEDILGKGSTLENPSRNEPIGRSLMGSQGGPCMGGFPSKLAGHCRDGARPPCSQTVSEQATQAAVPDSSKGKAMIEERQQFSVEELQAAFAQVLAEANGQERVVLEAVMNAVIARKAN
jgi:hypothetical protein